MKARWAGLLLAGAALPACVGLRGPGPPRPGHARLGPERVAIAYDDPHAGEKALLFQRINRDRALHGVPPLSYEPRAALVGDLFCRDAARSGTRGHWDAAGRAPYLRWGQAGGVDYHAQNAGSHTNTSGRLFLPLLDLLLERHEAMMAERPPDDGHRRTILDPLFTHVGIGAALAGGEFRMTEEFTRVGFEWIEVPKSPLAVGGLATFAGRPLAGWEVGLVEVRFEPPPRPLLPLDPCALGAYAYPPIVRRSARSPPPGSPTPAAVGVISPRGAAAASRYLSASTGAPAPTSCSATCGTAASGASRWGRPPPPSSPPARDPAGRGLTGRRGPNSVGLLRRPRPGNQ